MNPEFVNFAVTPLYAAACPYLHHIKTNEGANPHQILASTSHTLYLWAIGVTQLINHPPLLSGTARTLGEAIHFATQFGFTNVDTNSRNQANTALREFISCNTPIVSKLKRQSGDYALAAWHNRIHYLMGAEPAFYSDHIDPSSITEIILEYGNNNPFAAESNGEFIRSYIRKREAMRKIGAIPCNTDDFVSKIEFVHADHNEQDYSTNKKNWQRHRIIKVTDKYVFIDSYPFFGKAYLRQGWQARIIYMRILDREIFERDGEYYHRPSHATFYSEQTVKKRRWKCRLNDLEENIVIELPSNDIDWAMKVLGIDAWPTTISVIKKAFVKKSFITHPDKGGSNKDFIQCRSARDFLLDMCDDE
ncbi:heat shock protein DnaJ domain protein [Nitrosomonas sp. Is79A3]|uniref:molecular chaperone DnaJ n=1 Tax=Nitrosomonas sp. (strain Is79A3) TaxID=261292 RepID=UPI000215CFD8